MMRGQQFSAVAEAAHDDAAHEDFENIHSPDAINYFNHWNHCKTKVGIMLSPDAVTEGYYDPEDELVFRAMRNSFCQQLDDTDATIFRMREDGHTRTEIAEALGFKNHSTVTKHLQAMRKRWDLFTAETEKIFKATEQFISSPLVYITERKRAQSSRTAIGGGRSPLMRW